MAISIGIGNYITNKKDKIGGKFPPINEYLKLDQGKLDINKLQ